MITERFAARIFFPFVICAYICPPTSFTQLLANLSKGRIKIGDIVKVSTGWSLYAVCKASAARKIRQLPGLPISIHLGQDNFIFQKNEITTLPKPKCLVYWVLQEEQRTLAFLRFALRTLHVFLPTNAI